MTEISANHNLHTLLYRHIIQPEETNDDFLIEFQDGRYVINLVTKLFKSRSDMSKLIDEVHTDIILNLPDEYKRSYKEKPHFLTGENINACDLEELVWRDFFRVQLAVGQQQKGILDRMQDANKSWVKKYGSPVTVIKGCTDKLEISCTQKSRKKKMPNYLLNRQKVPISTGFLSVVPNVQSKIFPKWFRRYKKLHTLGIVGRGKHIGTAVDKICRRAAEYSIINENNIRYGLKERSTMEEAVIRNDVTAFRIFVPLPEMVDDFSTYVIKAFNQFQRENAGHEYKIDRRTEYNAIYIDMVSKLNEFYDLKNFEAQVTSVPDFLYYEFCGERARGLFDQKRNIDLRPKVYEQQCIKKHIKHLMADLNTSEDRAKEILNEQYRTQYLKYASRFKKFVESATKSYDQEHLQPLIVALEYMDRNTNYVATCLEDGR